MPVVCTYIHTNILLFRIYACMCVRVCVRTEQQAKSCSRILKKKLCLICLTVCDCALSFVCSPREQESGREWEKRELISESKSEVGASSAFGLLHAIQYYSIRLRIKLVFHGVQRLREHAYIQKTRYIHIHTRMYVHTQIRVCVCVCMHVYYMYIFVVLIWLGQKSAPLYGVFLVSGTTLKTTEQKNKRTHIRNIYATIFKYSTCLCVRVCEIFLIKNEIEPRKKCAKKNICKIYKIVIIIIII